jgi:hypothetical protein
VRALRRAVLTAAFAAALWLLAGYDVTHDLPMPPASSFSVPSTLWSATARH